MRVFVAGATGVVGRQLVPQLVASGHEVVGMTMRPEKSQMLRGWGAIPVVGDALDPESVGLAVSEFAPEAIVHQLTGLSGGVDPRHQERDMMLTNRLRTEATDHLLSAGRAVAVRRFVAQSFAVGTFARTGGPVKSEDDPLDPSPPRTCAPPWTRFATSRGPSSVPSGRRASCFATAPSTVPVPGSPPSRRGSRRR